MHPQVDVSEGRLVGRRRHGVEAFRGVPYAAPPVGARRFCPPEQVLPWAGVRPALEPSPGPAQLPAPFPLTGPDIYAGLGPTSEDCLYLDVWTPVADGQRRPVMVWVPGGAFVRGAGSQSVYDGARLAHEHGVVVVSVNYRLGALGFLASGEKGTANLALRDQIAALRWVASNIAAFGGDPANVTVFGESAGAVSIAALLVASDARGLFHRAIAQSGAGRRLASEDTARAWSESVLRTAGVSSVDQLRAIDVGALLAAQAGVGAEMFRRHGLAGGYQPWVDGELVREQPAVAAASGRTAQVPLLTGWNRNEMGLWRALHPELAELRWDELDARIGHAWGDLGRALAALRRAESVTATPAQIWESLATDVEFALPTQAFAVGHARVAPTYLYRFDWGGPLHPDSACHFMEVPFVFDTLEAEGMGACVGRSPATERLGRVMRAAWTSFARGETPELPGGRWEPVHGEKSLVIFDTAGDADSPTWASPTIGPAAEQLRTSR